MSQLDRPGLLGILFSNRPTSLNSTTVCSQSPCCLAALLSGRGFSVLNKHTASQQRHAAACPLATACTTQWIQTGKTPSTISSRMSRCATVCIFNNVLPILLRGCDSRHSSGSRAALCCSLKRHLLCSANSCQQHSLICNSSSSSKRGLSGNRCSSQPHQGVCSSSNSSRSSSRLLVMMMSKRLSSGAARV